MLAAGLATPLAGAALTGTMTTAIRHVHAPKGPWTTEGGWEYNAVLIAAVLALVQEGPGPLSLDDGLGVNWSGTGWMLAALVAGVGGSLALSELARREAEAADGDEFAGGVPFQAAEQAETKTKIAEGAAAG